MLDTNAWASGELDCSLPRHRSLSWGELILHEFGHAFGLDHSPSPDEIMYWQAGNGVYSDGYFRGLYNAGDLTGTGHERTRPGLLPPGQRLPRRRAGGRARAVPSAPTVRTCGRPRAPHR